MSAFSANDSDPQRSLCQQGKTSVDLSNQFPAPRNQERLNACYGFAATASLGAAFKRMTGKVRTLSETYSLVSYLEDQPVDQLARRLSSEQPVYRDAKVSSKESALDFGEDFDVLKSVIARGKWVDAAADEQTSYKSLDDRIALLMVLKQGKGDPADLNSILQHYDAKLRAKAKDDGTADISQIQIYREKLFDRAVADNDVSKAHIALFILHTLARNDPLVREFTAYHSAAATAQGTWNFSMSGADKDAFFASQENMDLIESYARDKGISPNDLAAALLISRNYRETLEKLYPGKFPAESIRGYNLDAIKEKIQQECDNGSKSTQTQILNLLCQGIPVEMQANMDGFELYNDSRAPAGPDAYWSTVTETDYISGHAMVIQGISQENGVPYLVFRNSWGPSSKARIPLKESCRISALIKVFVPTDTPYVVSAKPAVAAPADAVPSPSPADIKDH